MKQAGVRTTVTLDRDIMLAVRQIAAANDEPIGKVLSTLVRRGLSTQLQTPEYEPTLGYKLLPVSPNARPGTLEEIWQLQDELE